MDSVPRMLLDTTVYIDKLQGRMTPKMDLLLDKADIWHSSVTECEMGALAGLLDPQHPDTSRAVEEVIASIEARKAHRIVNPDRDIWREAGILAGLLARLQQYGKADQRRALNDALIFLSAAKAGLAVLTRNVADYDLLMQLAPQGQAVFYEL
jgi:predicted nucleic acid-binding protein